MFNLIANINGSISITPYKIDDELYLKINILHNHLEYNKFIHYNMIRDEGFGVYIITKMLLEVLNIKEEKDGD